MGNILLKHRLNKHTDENTDMELSMKGVKTWCKVLSCYDGDTITIAIPFRGHIIKEKLRLVGIDSPEMKPKRIEGKEEERKAEVDAAIKARDFLKSVIMPNGVGKILRIELDGREKWGRLLGRIYLEEGNCCCVIESIDISHLMLEKGHAYAYDGGTKKPFNEL